MTTRLITIIILLTHICVAQNKAIKTKYGFVAGYEKDNLQIFKGIPFAKPPVGKLRWAPPQAPKKWKGVKMCTQFSASPIQAEPKPFYCWSEEFIAPPSPLSEDCLYLNVWTKTTDRKANLPVFVWIYGGGFSSGSAACAIYDGASYAQNDIVFVSLNYRVGALGFMAHPELTAEQGGHSGNYGILDQIQALKWVKENIQYFGGDANNVTVAGQSAGSMSVNCLIASPLATGLFQKAIPQSGALLGGAFSTTLPNAELLGVKLQEKVGAKSLAGLRNLTSKDILDQSQGVGRFAVNADNFVLPTNATQYFAEGKQNQVALLSGWVAGDGGLVGAQIKTATVYKQGIDQKYGKNAPEFLQIYGGSTDLEAKKSQETLALMAFPIFGSHLLLKHNRKSSFMYEVNFVPTDKPGFPNYGAFHTSEVPYVLGNLHTWARPWQTRDFEHQKLMSSYWMNFIKTGNPNGVNLPEWKAYTADNQYIQVIDAKAESMFGKYQKQTEVLEKLGL